MKILGLAAVAWSISLDYSQADTWNFAVPYSYQSFQTNIAEEFGRILGEKTDGAIDVKVHASGSLFKHGEIKNAVRSGQATVGQFVLSTLSNENPIFEADSVPFLASSYDDAKRLWQAAKPLYDAQFERQGLMILWAVPQQPQAFWSSTKLDAENALSGAQFRTYNATTERMASLLGATPTTVEVVDLPQAFSTGRVTAMVTSPATGVEVKAWDFLSYFYDTQGWLPNMVVVMQRRVFDRLSPEHQEAVLAAASEVGEMGRARSEQETLANIEMLREHGIEIHDPSDSFKAALQAVGETLKAEWLAVAGDDGEALLEAYEAGR